MSTHVATRKLLWSEKNSEKRTKLTIRIEQPFIVEQASVNFPVDGETGGCRFEIVGLPEKITDVAYGADLLQALQLAANVEPLLKRLSRKYDLFFSTGEAYFEKDLD